MNPLLQTHFETALDHPNGIKKLRELILSLAMQGKLVIQDKNDQPARELLKEIQAEKERLVKEGKIKKTDALPPIKEEEKPFVIPEGWEWVRLGEVSLYNGRPNIESKQIPKESWILELEDIEKETSRLLQKVRYSERETKSTKSSFKKGDVLYGKLRPYLDKVIVADEDGYCTTEIVPVVPFQKINSQFLRKLLKRPYFLQYVTDKSYGVKMPRLGTLDAVLSLHPLPPLAEQKRIVEKVDQLFLLCDELERLQQSRNSKRKELHNSVLTQCIEADSVSSFQTSFQFLTTHFHELYSVKENVKELRKAVLQWAVMGKLVPQDKNDQPARELLKEIQAEKERLVKEGKIRKMDALPPIKDEEKPFVIPEGWEWVRIRDVRYDWGQKVPNKKFTYIDVGSILNLEGKLGDELNVLTPEVAPSRARKIVKKNTVIYSTVRPYLLNIAIIDRDFEYEAIASTAFAILHPHSVIVSKFIFYYLRSPSFIQFVESLMKGVAYPAINDGDFYSALFPLPPLAEQKQIVEKVDELLALCDRLEEEIEKAESKRGEILEGMVRV